MDPWDWKVQSQGRESVWGKYFAETGAGLSLCFALKSSSCFIGRLFFLTVHKRLSWLAGKLFNCCKGTLFLASKLHRSRSSENKMLNVVVSQSKPCLE